MTLLEGEARHYGPQTQQSDTLHAVKYREPGESFREAMQRIAFALQDDNPHYTALREILLEQRFVPAGRIQAAMGRSLSATPYNCYVSGTLADSLVHGVGSIMDRLREAASTLRLGGGIGYDFSTLRPAGDAVAKLGTQSCGPVDFIGQFDHLGTLIRAVGHRHGAQMGILRVDHPDIEAFVRIKQTPGKYRRFNLSVAVTHEFMNAVDGDHDFDLKWGGRVYRTIKARDLWEKIMRSTWEWAEPGVIFIDRVNEMNNLYYCETIAATNPCGEQPLPPFGACLLGSFNLVKYLNRDPQPRPVNDLGGWSFDFDRLRADVPTVVRAMDNVVDRATYPLAEQRAEALSKRRMGLGVMGLANAIEACGYGYGGADYLGMQDRIMQELCHAAYRASIQLAKEKGPFTLFDAERYGRGRFISTLPDDIRAGIARDGIRNSHLTSIAPTGTISMTADNVTGGIEPVIFHEIKRTVEGPTGYVEQITRDYGVAFLGTRGRLAGDVLPEEHVEALARAQQYVDSSISKTVNVDGVKLGWEGFKAVYHEAYDRGAKSCTTYNSTGKREPLITSAADTEGGACVIAADGTRSCE